MQPPGHPVYCKNYLGVNLSAGLGQKWWERMPGAGNSYGAEVEGEITLDDVDLKREEILFASR